MNDRLVVQDGFLKPSNTPEAPRVRKWSRSVAVAVTVSFMSLTMSHQGRILPKIRGRMLAARMIPGWKWEVGCSRFPIVLPKPHLLSQAASLVVLDTLFPEGTQKPQKPSGPQASMGPTSSDQPIFEARNRSIFSARRTITKASLLSVLQRHPTTRRSKTLKKLSPVSAIPNVPRPERGDAMACPILHAGRMTIKSSDLL